MSLFIVKSLQTLSKKNLQVLAKNYNINRLGIFVFVFLIFNYVYFFINKTKNNIIEQIKGVSRLCNESLSTLEQIEKDLQTKWQTSISPTHTFYKDIFNLDDLIDRK